MKDSVSPTQAIEPDATGVGTARAVPGGVALAQGDLRAWWGLAVLAALAFLAKFPGVLALAAVVPTLFNPDVCRSLASPT
jgi:hypothetical protein